MATQRILRAAAVVAGAVTIVLAFMALLGHTESVCKTPVCDPVIEHVYHPVRGLVILAIGALVVTTLMLLARRRDPAIEGGRPPRGRSDIA